MSTKGLLSTMLNADTASAVFASPLAGVIDTMVGGVMSAHSSKRTVSHWKQNSDLTESDGAGWKVKEIAEDEVAVENSELINGPRNQRRVGGRRQHCRGRGGGHGVDLQAERSPEGVGVGQRIVALRHRVDAVDAGHGKNEGMRRRCKRQRVGQLNGTLAVARYVRRRFDERAERVRRFWLRTKRKRSANDSNNS